MKAVPYIHFGGQCRDAFAFYADALRGKVTMTMTYAEAPVPTHIAEEHKGLVMHSCLSLDGEVIMGSDTPPGLFEGNKGFSISLHPKDAAEADRIYAALVEGGSIRMPLQETFWAHRFGMVTDRFGTPWMISCDKTPGVDSSD